VPSSFPGAIDNFTDPLSNSALNSPSHAGQHQDLNDAVEKIETYMGLVKVIPTAISSAGGTAATLSANGTINVGTSNTSITITNCFSALYDNYRILFDIDTGPGNASIQLQLRTSTTTTTTNYKAFLQTPFVDWTTGALTSVTSTTAMIPTYGHASAISGSFDLIAPFLTAPTTGYGQYATVTNAGITAAIQTDSTSFVSAVISPASGSITGGTIRVYGYRN
jgi:hypothetical protein